jgi:NAD+--asparagine ADP-ribosyltransferase
MTTRTDTTDRRILTQQTTLSIALVGVILAATITGVWRAAVLSSDVTHLSGEVAELKVLVRVSAASYESSSTSNATAIQLIVERMKMDDGREEVDRKLFAEIQDRLVRLEGLVKE